MRDPTVDRTLCTELDEADYELVGAVKAATALDTDANFVRAAAYYFAIFVLGQAAVPTTSFLLRTRSKGSDERTAVRRLAWARRTQR